MAGRGETLDLQISRGNDPAILGNNNRFLWRLPGQQRKISFSKIHRNRECGQNSIQPSGMIHVPMRETHAGQRRVLRVKHGQHGLRIVCRINKDRLFGLRIDQDIPLDFVAPDVAQNRHDQRRDPRRR